MTADAIRSRRKRARRRGDFDDVPGILSTELLRIASLLNGLAVRFAKDGR